VGRPRGRVGAHRPVGRPAADLGTSEGATARLDRPPCPARGFNDLCAARGWRPEQLVLFGGDDYELLFTLSPKKWAAGRRAAKAAEIPLTVIGQITREAGALILVDGLREAVLDAAGWRHTGG
jgi:thiamine-monophosphate kinase